MGELKTRYAPFPVAQTNAYNSALYSDSLIKPFWTLRMHRVAWVARSRNPRVTLSRELLRPKCRSGAAPANPSRARGREGDSKGGGEGEEREGRGSVREGKGGKVWRELERERGQCAAPC